MEPSKNIIVFYHADCIDGFSAAWVAYKKFGDQADYIPQFHDAAVPEVKDKEIYCVDITFPDDIMLRLMKDNKRVTAIDHHVSRKEMTLATFEPLYDVNHSGCVLAWRYFFPETPVPTFLLYVEDYDIWIQKYKSKQMYMHLNLVDQNFTTWNKFVTDFEDESKREEVLQKGEILMQYESRVIDHNIEQNAYIVTFEGYEVYCINTNDTPSAVSQKLIKLQPPFAIIWEQRKNGAVHVHLRGVGDIDLTTIAQKYGGGGHKLAAAFRLPSLADIPWKAV